VTRPITCLVADDHPAVVDSVARCLIGHGIEVVAKAHTGSEAVEQIERCRPRVAVIDLHMPGFTGIDVAQQVVASSPETGVIVYTGFGDGHRLTEALGAGIRGFIVKDAPLSDLIRAITMVADGLPYVDPTLAALLVREGASQPGEPLNDSERDVIRLLADGLTTERIAQLLGVSGDTARERIHGAMQKLHAETRTQAVATALRRCLIT
jgi:DNA-binding NarL/FixJ family response regulator